VVESVVRVGFEGLEFGWCGCGEGLQGWSLVGVDVVRVCRVGLVEMVVGVGERTDRTDREAWWGHGVKTLAQIFKIFGNF